MGRLIKPGSQPPLFFTNPSRRDVLRFCGGLALTLPLGGIADYLTGQEIDPSKRHAEDLAMHFAKYYEPVKVKAKPQIPGYTLPLDPEQVANLKDAAKLGLTAAEPALRANGFVVLPGKGNEDIVAPYKDLKERQVPIFVTADTLLHLYHVQFDETLKDIEEREFYPDLVALTEALARELEGRKPAVNDDDFRAAHEKVLTYLAIGLKALKPNAALPQGVDARKVEVVLDRMKQHEGFWPDPEAAERDWPLFRYAEDFSQYVPRGHYTRSEVLKRYFVAMMWFGRMTFLLKGDADYGPHAEQPALVSVAESNEQTLAAALLTKALDQAVFPDRRKAREVWERIYVVTSFYVGLADDLGLPEYRAALTKVCGAALDLTALGDDQKLVDLKLELARHTPPAIYSGTGGQSALPDAGPGELLQTLAKTQGLRLMGQRFVPDSYMMGKLVWPTVGAPMRSGMFTRVETDGGPARGFPRGLDVLALLGSRRARELLHELGDDAYRRNGKALGYAEALANLEKEYAGLGDADWNRNLYWSWLHALKPLLAHFGEGYQTFMTTRAYRTKSLNTALASWAQLRHDTILYAKQSYTMKQRASATVPPPRPVQGYVEPVPEFYARLLALARMTNRGLSDLKVLDAAAQKRLTEFEKLLERLLAIAEEELADRDLTEADYEFICGFGANLEAVVVAPNTVKVKAMETELLKARQAQNWKRAHELIEQIDGEQGGAMKTTIVADVHTDQNTRQVLEEGTGYVDLGVFVYRQPDGRLVLGAGPVLSYHEFKHPMADRLTDERWRKLLAEKGSPTETPWTKEYLSPGCTYVCSAGD